VAQLSSEQKTQGGLVMGLGRGSGVIALVVAVGALAAGCSSDDGSSDPTNAPAVALASTETATTEPAATDAPDTTTAVTAEPTSSTDAALPEMSEPDAATAAAIDEALGASPAGCDPLDTRACLLPFPSDAYTVGDESTDTGVRVAMPVDATTANVQGVSVDLTEWNRNDGFSPNSTLLAYVPGIAARASKLPPWTDLDRSIDDGSTVVIVDTATGERIPLWAELDVKAVDDADRALVIHPAVVLREGHHYAVGLRTMHDADANPIEPSAAFRAYRDRLASAALEDRRPVMETTFAALAAAGMDRSDLQLAWDFTVASTRSLSERMLSIRDTALAELADAAPEFTVTSSAPGTDDSNTALQIIGTYTVPNFLTNDGSPGNRFNYVDATDPDALPAQNGTLQADFVCNVSAATMNGTEPAHLVEYGHGLLGDAGEIDAGNVRDFANEHNIVFCATYWAGLSSPDIGNAAATLAQIGNFPTVADRLQQGVLNQIFLGRLMTRHGGLSSLPELQRADGSLLIDTAHLDYDGNSQGGIMGIMLAAVSPDIERAVFGVPGINYSLLLPRSVDFTEYEAVFKPAYPNDLDRMIDINLLQMLWDRGEGAGYVQHVTADPYPGTPVKTVLLDVAFGDWQVSELAAMVAARAMTVTIHRPVAAEGRWQGVTAGWGLQTTTYPSSGSGIIVWDSGADPIPVEGVAPSTGRDPHGDPRSDADVRTQKAAFLFDDTLIDVCNGAPCTADPRD
jgi:hypothetical protein